MKSDNYIRRRCINSIKKSTIKPYDFSFTKFFEIETFPEIVNDNFEILETDENELPIAQTIVNVSNWTFVTSRQIITCIEGIVKNTDARKVLSHHWGDFKGHFKTSYTIGELQLDDGQKFEIFIETGRASMVMIYAVMFLVWAVKKHNSQ